MRRAPKEYEPTASNGIYHAIFNSVNDAIILRDHKTRRIVDVNKKLCEMTGFTADEIRKLEPGWFTKYIAQNGMTIADHYEGATRGIPQLFERECRRRDGSSFWIESNLRKVTINGHDYFLSVIRDITERK